MSTALPADIREEVRLVLPRVEGGRGFIATLLGAAESGKSRLVADLARDAKERGWTTLLATANPRSSELPRGLVLDALGAILPGVASAKGPSTPHAPAPPGLGLPLALADLDVGEPVRVEVPADRGELGGSGCQIGLAVLMWFHGA